MCLIIISDFQQLNLTTNSPAQQTTHETTTTTSGQAGETKNTIYYGPSDRWQSHWRDSNDEAQIEDSNQDTLSAKSEKSRGRIISRTGGLFNVFLFAEANSDANRLYEDLMMTYNRIVRPVQNNSERLVVSLSLKLSQLIEVVSFEEMCVSNRLFVL